MSETAIELTDAEATAFRLAESDDPVKRLVGFSRLRTLGFATVYAVGGRFLHCSLNENGKARRDVLSRTKAGCPVQSREIEMAFNVRGGLEAEEEWNMQIERAIYDWIRDDAPLTAKMTLLPEHIRKLADKISRACQ